MKNYLIPPGIPKTITLIVFSLIAVYIFVRHERWINFSQGWKPLLMGILLLLTASITHGAELDSHNINDLFNILILRNSANYSVAIARLIALGYVISIYGFEILLMVLIEKYGKRKSKA